MDESTVIHTATQCMQEQLSPGVYIVLSQDCDILNLSLEKEPVVEIIAASKIQKCSSTLSTGKNPRQLHLDTNEKGSFLEVFPHKRFFYRQHFCSHGE